MSIETFKIVRYDVPLDGAEHVLPGSGGCVVGVAPEPDLAALTLAVWVTSGVWPGHETSVRVVRDGEPFEVEIGEWGYGGSTSLAHGAPAPLHVLHRHPCRPSPA